MFVGNLPYDTTEQDLATFMADAGQVVSSHFPTDRETGRPRGFAFVEFRSEEEAAKAVELFHDKELKGRRLRLDAAQERPPRRGFGGPPPSRKPEERGFREPDFGGGDDFGPSGGGRGNYRGSKKSGGSQRGRRGLKRSL